MTSLMLAPPPRLSDHERGATLDAALEAVGVYVVLNGLEDKYGVQLLHGHFPVADDEAIVEYTTDNTLHTRVVPRSQVASLASTTWGFTLDGTPVAVQWTEDEDGFTEADSDLEGFGRFLAAEGLTRTFAVVVLSDPIELGPDEVPLEYTDVARRIQWTVPVPRSSVTEYTAATWGFTPDGRPVTRGHCPMYDVEH